MRNPRVNEPLRAVVSITSAVPNLLSFLDTTMICMNGTLALKFSVRCANQTARTFVITSVPKLPWSPERFQTPLVVLMMRSPGSIIRALSRMMPPRNLMSRKRREVSNALNNDCTVENSRGTWRFSLENMNSNLEWANLVRT